MRGESTGLAYCGEARTKTLQAVVGRGCSHKTLFPRTLSQDTLRDCSQSILRARYSENALTRYSRYSLLSRYSQDTLALTRDSHKMLSQDTLSKDLE